MGKESLINQDNSKMTQKKTTLTIRMTTRQQKSECHQFLVSAVFMFEIVFVFWVFEYLDQNLDQHIK